MWSSDFDPYEPSDLDRVLTREADTALYAHEDPEHGVHGARPFATWPCDWHVEVMTEDGPIGGPCGAPAHFTSTRGSAFRCEAGHVHRGIEAELGAYGLEWEREQEDRRAWGAAA